MKKSQPKPLKRSCGEKILQATICPQGDGKGDPIPVEVRINTTGIEVRVAGYGEATCEPGYGSPIWIEHYDGKLALHVWADINREDPTHSVDLEGAREECRKD